jgi:hypothetical protein
VTPSNEINKKERVVEISFIHSRLPVTNQIRPGRLYEKEGTAPNERIATLAPSPHMRQIRSENDQAVKHVNRN